MRRRHRRRIVQCRSYRRHGNKLDNLCKDSPKQSLPPERLLGAPRQQGTTGCDDVRGSRLRMTNLPAEL